MEWDSEEINSLIDQALAEDLGSGDLTSNILFPSPPNISAVFLAKEKGILAGLPLVGKIFSRLDRRCKIQYHFRDGNRLSVADTICKLTGPATALLAGERLALNFVQRLSGIATQTGRYVRLAAPKGIQVLDTRKTTPLLRQLEKYAVTQGGGTNHRTGLYDGILVKDNHLKLQPGFVTILKSFRNAGYLPGQIELEVTNFKMLKQAIDAGGCWFLLDNMSPSMIRRCVAIKKPHMRYEVSGGITVKNFPSYLIQGVDAISIGELTHSAKALDISMEFL